MPSWTGASAWEIREGSRSKMCKIVSTLYDQLFTVSRSKRPDLHLLVFAVCLTPKHHETQSKTPFHAALRNSLHLAAWEAEMVAAVRLTFTPIIAHLSPRTHSKVDRSVSFAAPSEQDHIQWKRPKMVGHRPAFQDQDRSRIGK